MQDLIRTQELEKKLFLREREFSKVFQEFKILNDKLGRLLSLSNSLSLIYTSDSIDSLFENVLTMFSKINVEKILILTKHNNDFVISNCSGYSRKAKLSLINLSLPDLKTYYQQVIKSKETKYFSINDPLIENLVNLCNFIISPIINNENKVFALLIAGVSRDKLKIFESFNESSVEFFTLLTTQLSIGAQKYQYLKDLQNFNVSLEEKIQERTKKLQKTTNELKKAKDLSEEANNAKSQFLSVVSHELRTPLHVILGINGLLTQKCKKHNDNDAENKLAIVKNSAERLLSLVNDILDLSKLEKGKTEKNLETVQLKEIIETTRNEAYALKNNDNIMFEMVYKPEISGLFFQSDKRKIQQVISNLLSNAYKFTSKGKIVFTLKINSAKKQLLISVSDTGTGIEKRLLKKIFEPFYQIEKYHLHAAIKGSGLGLPICKQYIELLGGTIKAQSVLGQGSIFSFITPFIIAKQAIKKKKTVPENYKILFKELKNKTILLCDDDEFNRCFLEMILKDKINYDLVEDGFKVLEKVKDNTYDAIFLDIQMPEIDGIETLKLLSQVIDTKKIPVYALTALAMKTEQNKLHEYGFTNYLLKPFSESEFFEFIIQELIKKK
ncbi:hybrid sensor histidine kinase/response regulator [Candidatus Margulisiibacteriota bacterium]